MKRWAVHTLLIVSLAAGATVQCGGGGFLKWFWETFGWCGGAVVNCVFFQNCAACGVPPKPSCRAGCTYGYRDLAVNAGDNTCTWQRDPGSFDCGRTIYVGSQSFCDTACIDTPFADVGYDAATRADAAGPIALAVRPAESSALVDAADVIRVQFDETIARRSIELSGTLAAWAAPPELETGAQYNDTVVIRPGAPNRPAHWPTGAQSLQVSVRDEAANPASRTISYPAIRSLAAELASAAAAIENTRLASGWPPSDSALHRIGNSQTFWRTFANNSSAIYANSGGQAVPVYGDIYAYYRSTGQHTGHLQTPTRAEYDCALLVRCADFAGGSLRWNALTRQVTVHP